MIRIYFLLIGLSCLFITLVNLDRYAAICHPFKYLKYATSKLYVTISITSCLLCALVAIALLATDFIFRLYSTAVVFVLIVSALTLMLIYCNWKIFRVIHKHRREISSVQRNVDLHQSRFRNDTKRYHIIALLIIIFIICKLPPSISFMLLGFWKGQITTPLVVFSIISEFLMLLNSFLNPLVYYFNIRSFRDAMKGIMCCHRLT